MSLFCDSRSFDEAVKGEDKRDEAPKFQFKVCLMSFITDAQGNGLLFSGVTVCCSIVTHNVGIMTTINGQCRAPHK